MGIRAIEFKTEYRPNKPPVEWVLYAGSDSYSENGQLSASTWERVSKLRPPEVLENDTDGLKMAALRYVWSQIEPAYEAWKSGEEMPETGTPLAAWGGVSASQIAALKGIGIKTVEDLAGLSDSNMKAVLPNMRDLRTMARQWMEGRPQAERDAELAELKAQNAAMMEMLAELKAAQTQAPPPVDYLGSLQNQQALNAYNYPDYGQASAVEPTAEKPRRGRPPKSEAA
jgi:hypothetical protein